MQLLTTDAYLAHGAAAGSDSALQLLSVSIFCNGLIVFGFYTLLSLHAWRPLVATLCIGAVISLALNIIWIPTFGFMGAATTSVIVHTLVAAALLGQATVTVKLRTPWQTTARWMAWMLGTAGILYLLLPFLVSASWTVGGIAFGGFLALGFAWILRLPQSLLGKSPLA